MRLQLITLLGEKFNEDVYETNISTADGEIGVFPGHEPLVTLAIPGVISVRHQKTDPDDKMELFAISGGVVEISPDYIKVLVDEAESGSDIVESESKAALELAMKMRDDAKDQVELEKAYQLIDRHQVRLKVAGLRRRNRQ